MIQKLLMKSLDVTLGTLIQGQKYHGWTRTEKLLITVMMNNFLTQVDALSTKMIPKEAVDVPLSFKLKDGESQFFYCRVKYEIVENGAKVSETKVYRFPESGVISYG